MKKIIGLVAIVMAGVMLVGCSCNTCQSCDKPATQKCYKGENQ